MLVVKLAAAPINGAANDALIQLLSETFDLPRRSFRILSGHKSRDKRIEVDGLDTARVAERLSDILPPGKRT